jgi:hypothetical protein
MIESLQEKKELSQVNYDNEIKFKKFQEFIEINPDLKTNFFNTSNASMNINKTIDINDNKNDLSNKENLINLNKNDNTKSLYVKTIPRKNSSSHSLSNTSKNE